MTDPDRPRLRLASIVLECTDAQEMKRFYQRLLGWEVRADEGDWVILRNAEGLPNISIQADPAYVRPTWPGEPERQQMMLHLDIWVDDLDAAGEHAIAAGAVLADYQPQERVRVYLDPAGHPFCLFLD